MFNRGVVSRGRGSQCSPPWVHSPIIYWAGAGVAGVELEVGLEEPLSGEPEVVEEGSVGVPPFFPWCFPWCFFGVAVVSELLVVALPVVAAGSELLVVADELPVDPVVVGALDMLDSPEFAEDWSSAKAAKDSKLEAANTQSFLARVME